MKLPDDPFMLLSIVNMKLRDNDYKDLDELCDDLGCEKEELTMKLNDAGFEYMASIKQFR